MRRLSAESTLVQRIPDQTYREDGHGEGVAAIVRISAGEFGDGFIAVFCAGGGIPEGRVEDDGACGDCVALWLASCSNPVDESVMTYSISWAG